MELTLTSGCLQRGKLSTFVMKRVLQFWRSFDTDLVVVSAICLIAIWPFLTIPGLPEGTDAELHIFRLHELSLLVRGGEWYPRWAPDFYHGYGYPIFNFYAPLTYYVGLVVELLPQFDAVAGIKAVFMLAILLAGVGMYGFVRDNWGRQAGFVAAALYVYAPYVQYIDPHARGVAPESFSFGVFAMALWAMDRLRRKQTAVSIITAVLSVTAVILSHNLMALLFFGILFAWVVWQWGCDRFAGERSNVKWLFVALLLGLGVAAFFWLPVILERNTVNLNTLIGEGDNYDFRTHFLSLREMLAFSSRLDWGATEPYFRFNLGVAQWGLGLLGIVMLGVRKTAVSARLLFFAVTLFGLLFLMLPASTFIWESLPFMPFFQFPWRLLGAAAAMLAVLGGVGVSSLVTLLQNRNYQQAAGWLPAAAVGLTLMLALPLSQPAPWEPFGDVHTLRMSLIEQSGRWLGTTSTADYLPVTVDATPKRKREVVQGFFDGVPLDRVNRIAKPEGAEIVGEEVTPLHFRYRVSTPKQFRLRLYLFDFPGWVATVDGAPAETELARPDGFIIVKVPQGEHVVDMQFKNTPARNTAVSITLISLLLTGLAAGYWWRKRPYVSQKAEGLPQGDWRVVGVVGVITAVSLLIIQPAGWLHDNSTGQVVASADVDLYADFGEQIALLGYDVNSLVVTPGDLVAVTLYWKAAQKLDINYQSFVHILRADGSLLTQSDHLNPGEFPTRRWPTDKYVRDQHLLLIPVDTPPGEYTVSAGLWVQAEGWRLPLFDASDEQIGDNITLFMLTVREKSK